MAISKQQGEDFIAKMKGKAASKPLAPLAVVKNEPALVAPQPAPSPAPKGKEKPGFVVRTLSFRIAEADAEAVEDVIHKRKRAGEKGLTNQEAGREMVAAWLEKNGVKPFDYDAE